MNFVDFEAWLIDPSTSDQEVEGKRKFMKTSKDGPVTQLDVIGKSNGLLRKKAKEFFKGNKTLDIIHVMEYLEKIQDNTKILEARIISAYLLGMYKKQFDKKVWDRLHTWIDGVDHWTAADHLCIDVYGHFPVYDPPYYDNLMDEIISSNFWRRRIAVVCFIKHVRTSSKAVERMLNLMDRIVTDKQYYVRKAIPWLLREASKSEPKLIKAYIDKNRGNLKLSEMKEASKYL